MIKKYIYTILYFTLLLPNVGSAAPLLANPIATPTFQDFMDKILESVIQLGVMVLTIMLIYSGYLFVTAQGNDEQLAKAKEAFKWTVIGGGILIGASAIMYLVTGTIGAIYP